MTMKSNPDQLASDTADTAEPRETAVSRAAGASGGPVVQNADRFAPLAFLLMLAVAYTQIASLEVGTFSEPGPGLWPTLVSIVLAGCIIALFYVARDKPESVSRTTLMKVGVTVLTLALFPLLYNLLGFIPTGAIGAGVFAWLIGKEKPLTSILLGIGSSVLIYLLFGVLLDLRISPLGP